MIHWQYCLVLLIACAFGTKSVITFDLDEHQARKFAAEASIALHTYYDKLAADTFEPEIIPTYVQLFDTLMIKSEIFLNISRSLSQFDKICFKDTKLVFIIEKLKKLVDVSVLGADRYLEILSAEYDLNELATGDDIEEFTNQNDTLAYLPNIQNVFSTSSDPEEIKYYWNALRKKNERWSKNRFVVLINGIKDAANIIGITPFDFWMKDFNLTQMNAVMAQLESPYRQIHGFIRHQLNKKYGDTVINSRGLIPDYLYQQVLAQIWTSEGILEEIFPFKELPSFDKNLVNFYETMGFKKIPESNWGQNFKMKPDEGEGNCKPVIMAKTEKVFMHYCNKINFGTFLEAHGNMAELHVTMEKSHLPAYYSDSYQLEYAIGEAGILSASSPKYLHKMKLLPSAEISEQYFMNRLMRLNFHTMLNIPVYYVHTKLIADLLDGKFEMEELNKKYWEFMEKYVGVGRPDDRVPNALDFSFKFYGKLIDNFQAREFMSKVMSYQFYVKLCAVAGQYPKGYLQNCAFSDSTDAGDALMEMIKLGSSKTLREVLATILHENRKLNGDDLL